MQTCRAEILGGSVDGSVRRFDVRAGALWADQLHSPVTTIALSHDGNCVLASCLDGRMRLLDKDGGELLAQYSGARLWLHNRRCQNSAMLRPQPTPHITWSNGLPIRRPCIFKYIPGMGSQGHSWYAGHAVESAKMDCALTPTDAHVLSGSEDGGHCSFRRKKQTCTFGHMSARAHAGPLHETQSACRAGVLLGSGRGDAGAHPCPRTPAWSAPWQCTPRAPCSSPHRQTAQ